MTYRPFAPLSIAAAAALVATVLAVPASALAAPSKESAGAADPRAKAAASARPTKKRNTVAHAGIAPKWIQAPYLQRSGKKRMTVSAKLYVDPYRNPNSKRPKQRVSRQDHLHFRVAVSKRGVSTPTRPRSVNLLPRTALLVRSDQTTTVRKPGVLTVRKQLSKQASRQLLRASFAQRRSAVAVSASHYKDTFQRSPVWALKQVTAGDLAQRKDSAKVQRQRLKAAKEQRRMVTKPPRKGRDGQGRDGQGRDGQVRAAWAGDSPTFNAVYVENNSPFQQQLNWNPNLQCMWTGGVTNDPSDAVTETVSANSTVMFEYLGSSSQSEWPGLNGAAAGLNAPGTSASWSADLVKSATAAGQNLLGSLGQGSTYSEAGAVAAVGNAALTFLTKLIGNAPSDTCNDVATYPELFGLSTTVTGIGTDADPVASNAALPSTNLWNSSAASTASTPAAIGNAGSSAPVSAGFANNYLQQLLGAQTNYTYYWNGGQPAPMVSNNAASGTFTGGAGTVQDGLMQVVAPNPGNPGAWDSGCTQSSGWNECSYNTLGAMTINLVYLTNPTYQAGLQNQGGTPQLTVAEDAGGNYTLTCDLSGMNATLYLPFGANGGTTAIGSATMSQQATNSAGTAPQDANWMVNFFGISADGDYLYSFNDAPNGINTPALSANAQQQQVSIANAAASGGETTATGLVTPTDLANMQTIDGQSAVPARFGCNATPSITLSGLEIDAADGTALANAWGNDWPMPTVGGAGWPTNYWGSNYTYQTNWQWQTPVSALNLTFMGFPLSSDADPAAGSPPDPPLAVTANAGDTAAEVSWNAPTETGSAPITGYTATSSPGGQTCSAIAPATSCAIANLNNGKPYSFSVIAYSQAGASAPSLPSSAVTPGSPPGAPTAVTASPATLSAFVSWTQPALVGSAPIAGYTVTASPGGATCSALAPSTSCVVAGLAAGSSYTFTVAAENPYGFGPVSGASGPVLPNSPS